MKKPTKKKAPKKKEPRLLVPLEELEGDADLCISEMTAHKAKANVMRYRKLIFGSFRVTCIRVIPIEPGQ